MERERQRRSSLLDRVETADQLLRDRSPLLRYRNARVVLGVLELDLSIPATPHDRKSAQETRSGAGSRASRGVYVASSYVAVRVHSPIREEQ